MSSKGELPPAPRRGEVRRAERLRLRAERVAVRATQGSERERSKGPSEDRIKQWRTSNGNLTFFNCAPKQVHVPPVEDIPMTTEVLRDAFVSARETYDRPDDASGRANFLGAVYRQDGTLLPELVDQERLMLEERGRDNRQNPRIVERERMARARRVDETCVYLGNLKRLFGHFLLETLSRAWYLQTCDPATRVIFHASSHDLTTFGTFVHVIFRSLGLADSRILIATEDLRVKNLIVPTAQYVNTIKGSPGMCATFDHVREQIMRARPAGRATPRKLYLTRRHIGDMAQASALPAGMNAGPRRRFLNEDEAEAAFSRLGFEVVAPESLPFEEQVAMVANATHIAGTAGSALHLVLFNDSPATKLIELRTKPAWNQLIINAIRGVDAYHIWCVKRRLEARGTELDIDVIERAMKEIA